MAPWNPWMWKNRPLWNSVLVPFYLTPLPAVSLGIVLLSRFSVGQICLFSFQKGLSSSIDEILVTIMTVMTTCSQQSSFIPEHSESYD
ncbi:hypothetical protein M432DRAFT_134900 [Thermoascus aurantiacus ATCC 26904]